LTTAHLSAWTFVFGKLLFNFWRRLLATEAS